MALGPDEGNSLQYTGRENDGTGLYYYRARYYDPLLKQWVSEDPIGLAGGINQRAYVGGNPISFNDPRGLDNPGMGPYGPYWSTTPPSTPANPYQPPNTACVVALGCVGGFIMTASGGGAAGGLIGFAIGAGIGTQDCPAQNPPPAPPKRGPGDDPFGQL